MSRGPEEQRPDRTPDRFKEFGPTSFAVDHGISVKVLLVILTVLGIYSYATTPKESFPEIELPMVAVTTVYPGVSPADVESLITRPIEDELATIGDIDELTSTSTEGISSVLAEFETTVDLNEALQQVREKVDLARPELPADAEEPVISEFNVSEAPIMQVNLSGQYGLVRLKELAEDLQDRLETIPEVLRVDLRGGLEREVKVDVDLERLKHYGVGLYDIVDAIQSENVNIPGGSIDVGRAKYLVRVDGEFEDPRIIEDLVVTAEGQSPVYVRDVASVEFGFAERENFARLDGEDVVTLDIVKRSGRNIIATADKVRAAIAGVSPTFPPTTVVKITSDTSEDIGMMVSSLENNIVSGLILIVAVLLFFLGLTNSFFVGISIPTSMLLSFSLLKALGMTMNMVVLFSLILALGMLVDNAIVVVENIYRYMEEGWDRRTAAKKATGEVAMPVIAATLTTLAAFAPLLFWPGMTGEFMRFLPVTLIVTLSSSLVVAVVIIPALCADYMRLPGQGRRELTRPARYTLMGVGLLGLLLVVRANALTAGLLVATGLALWALFHYVLSPLTVVFQERLVPSMLRAYEGQLRWALEHRLAILGGTGLAFVASVVLFGAFNAGVEYFPEDIPPKQVFAEVETPVGTRAEATDRLIRQVESQLGQVPGREDWESRVAVTGGSGNDGGVGDMFGQGGATGPNLGRISLSFVDFQDRQADGFASLAWMQENLGRDLAGARVTVKQQQEGVPTGPAVNLEIVGEDPAVLKELSDRAIEILENDPIYDRMVALESDLDAARPELSVAVDRERAALYDLSTSAVGNAVRGAIQGVEAAKYRTGDDEYDIVVRLAPEYRQELDQLANLTVMAEGGRQIPLSSVASWTVGEGYGAIRRQDQNRMATVSADAASGVNTNALLAEARVVLADFVENLPPGYTAQYTGQQEDQAEAQTFLTTAFVMALFLIGFILVSQFNSVVKPVIILTSVLMSTVGVLLGLLVVRMPFGIIMTGVGIISLAGIVVNNAIVLIDYIDILRDRDGMDRREALVQGGRTRFRPVVLTALTTALGLVPLAVGLNFDFFGLYASLEPELFWGGEQAAWWGPMAVAVIAGIIFATFLTLVLVPVLYSLVDDGALLLRRWFVAGEEASGGPAEGGEGTPPGPPAAHEDRGRGEPARERPAREPAAAYRRRSPGLGGPELQPE